MIDLPALLKSLKLLVEAQGNEPVIAEDDITFEDIRALLGEIDRLKGVEQQVESCQTEARSRMEELKVVWEKAGRPTPRDKLADCVDMLATDRRELQIRAVEAEIRLEKLEPELKEFKKFAVGIRDGYDCDTGANATHSYCCRCCEAGDVLGEPPSVRDPRTRGG